MSHAKKAMVMWLLVLMGFIAGGVAGLILGNWLDRHDLLYACPRCEKRDYLVEWKHKDWEHWYSWKRFRRHQDALDYVEEHSASTRFEYRVASDT